MSARKATTALAGLVLAGAAAGCGVSLGNAASQNKQPVPRPVTHTAPLINPHPIKLPQRPAGVVDVDGNTQGSLTPAVVAGGVTGVTVNVANNGSSTAFDELCAGQIDAVDSPSPINPVQWQTCAHNGVKPVQLQVAADAVVVATKNESDVGVDCLTLGQIQEMFRAGSPISNWNQENQAFNIPVHTAGPPPTDATFQFFSRYVLLADPPSLTAFRSDYRQFPTQDGVRMAVVGNPSVAKTAAFRAKALSDLSALQAAIRSKQGFISQARAQLAQDQQSGANAGTIAADNNNLNTQLAQLQKLQANLPAAVRFANQTAQAANQIRIASGTAGIFRFSYYELWEEQLRPIEVDASESPTMPQTHNCIFPSQQTVTDATFPLARQLLITTTTAALKRPAVRAFLAAYLNEATGLATNARLVPLPDTTINQERGWVNNPGTAPVVVYTAAQIQAARAASQHGLPAELPTTSTLPAGPNGQPTTTTTTTTTTGTTTTGTTTTGGGGGGGATTTAAPQNSAPTVGPQAANY